MMNNTGIPSGSADTAPGALSVSGPQPVWMTLDEARERSFTGEIVFEVDPEVLAYLDNGDVYYAERSTDSSLGRRLLEAGVVDTSQLERGTVRVGDVEHLGRLFDRDPSVDRDAVLVVTESSTDDLIAELANRAVATVRVTAYRHHPSGVHRWFVARLDGSSRTAAPSASFHAPMIDEPSSAGPIADDELTIEWDDIDDLVPSADSAVNPVVAPAQSEFFAPDTRGAAAPGDDRWEPIAIDFGNAADSVTGGEALELFELSLDMASFIDAPEAPAPMYDDFDFEVAWPDGSTDLVTSDVPVIDDSAPFTQSDDGELRFELPEITVSDDVDHMPDDVAEAVRRAIAAIEAATAETPPPAPLVPPLDDHVVVDTFDIDFAAEAEVNTHFDTIEPRVIPAVPTGGFAPPTMDMRAEVIYAQAEQAAADAVLVAEASPAAEAGMPSLPTSGVASVVFVDDEPSVGSGDDRSSALRRLIGSLRRKEH